jgi:serine/threonine-protein phosphatase PP1 catalytic subunit
MHTLTLPPLCRGDNGMEVLLLVLALLCRYPANVFLIRGNHESGMMTLRDGFAAECRQRYNDQLYFLALEVFDLIPLAATIGGNNDIFAVHGGLTPQVTKLEDIAAIKRPVKVKHGTIVADLLWGDPTHDSDTPGALGSLDDSLSGLPLQTPKPLCIHTPTSTAVQQPDVTA